MEQKYSIQTQKQIDYLFIKLQVWKDLFFFKIEYHIDGWSIVLDEKNAYPRKIVIFKPFHKDSYSLKSFEVQQPVGKKCMFEELYSNEKISTIDDLVQDLREVIYGKDLFNVASKKYHKHIL